MPDEDVLLDLCLLYQPFFGIGSLHEFVVVRTNHVHLSEGADNADPQPSLPLILSSLLDDLEAPSLVHTHVASVYDNLLLALSGSID